MGDKFLIVGLDGGATKISGWSIRVDESNLSFALGSDNFQKAYSEYGSFRNDFKSVDITTQLAEFSENRVTPTGDELAQSASYTLACSDVIISLSRKHPGLPVLVGVGMPGLKMADKRGIACLLNGPRIPGYAKSVESNLKEAGIELVAPIHGIGSDADYCGIGEEYSSDGSFRDVDNAYYLGGGTGAADALKLNGNLVPLDKTKDWMAKTWELQNEKGKSLERYASAGGIQSIYSDYSGAPVEKLNEDSVYPDLILKRAINGEQAAQDTYRDVSYYLAQLLFERISTVYGGWKEQFGYMNPNRAPLSADHPFRDTKLEKIIIGQRLGNLVEESVETEFLWKPLLANLTKFIAESDLDQDFKNFYLSENRFKGELIKVSALREAPAIGAGIDAYLNFRK